MARFSSLLLMLTLSITLTGCLGSGASQPAKTPVATSVTLTPQNSALTVGKTLQFSAQATMSDGSTQDVTSTGTWGTSDSGIATVSTSGVVTAVKIGVVAIGVSTGQAKATAVLNITTKNFKLASLNGLYAFTLTSETSHPRFEAGSITADGAGNFTGMEDINASAGVQKAVALSGTYTVSPDGRGTLTLNTAGSSARTFHFVLSSNSTSPADNDAQLIQFDKAGTAVGQLQKQDTSAFNNTSLANRTYVFRVGGLDATQNPISRIGEFTLDSAGTTLTSGQQDENDNNTINQGAGTASSVVIASGSVGAVDLATGRATLTWTVGSQAADFAVYLVSANKMEIISLDAAPMLLGEAERQANPLPSSTAAGGYTLMTEIGGMRGQYWIMGEVSLDSSGNITNLAQHQDGGLTLGAFGGSFTMAASGRGALNEFTTQGLRSFTTYMVSGTRMYLQQTNNAHAAAGVAELQQPGTDGFGAATLNNTFVLVAADTSDANLAIVGPVVADGAGHLSGMLDVSQPQPGNPSQITTSTLAFGATYAAPGSIGLTTGTVNTQGTGVQSFVLYLVSSGKARFLGISPIDVNGTLLLQ